jgi:hypothetical protein
VAEQYEGELNAEFVVKIEGIHFDTEQIDEHSDTSLRSIVEQELTGEITDLSDITQLISEAREGDVKSVKITSFTVENHYGPDGKET